MVGGEDIEEVSLILTEMREFGIQVDQEMTISHSGSFFSDQVDELFETWLEEKGYLDIVIVPIPREEGGWWVWFDSEAPDSFAALVDSVNEIRKKFDEFGGTYDEWKFSGNFTVAHRVTQK
ncbi:hypothetical protein WL98_01930 [Burkholderia multivorans]|nr:hypothetical protein WL98_01930 [Burkholderia multivorans]